MTGGLVFVNDGSFWLLVGLAGLASIAALVASAAAWRAAKAARTALGQLEAARREVVVPGREWQERSPIHRRAADLANGGSTRPAAAPPGIVPPASPPAGTVGTGGRPTSMPAG